MPASHIDLLHRAGLGGFHRLFNFSLFELFAFAWKRNQDIELWFRNRNLPLWLVYSKVSNELNSLPFVHVSAMKFLAGSQPKN
jgi:hypothetical protein